MSDVIAQKLLTFPTLATREQQQACFREIMGEVISKPSFLNH
jgi:hypothetical protein